MNLHDIISGHNYDIIKKWLDDGANVNAYDDYALRFSAENGHTEIVKLLLEYGADISAYDDCALRYSAENGHYEIVKLLLEHGADVNAEYDYALRYSAENGHYEIVKLLLENKANVNADNNYALRYSAENGHYEIVKLLIDYGANINVLDKELYEKIQKYNKHDTILLSADEICYVCNEILSSCDKVCIYDCSHMTCDNCRLQMLKNNKCGYCRNDINYYEYKNVVIIGTN